jgi:hypothetical protein
MAPHTMTISPWSNPLFRPKKGCIANFLQAMNGGISTNDTSLHFLPWRTPQQNSSPSDGLMTTPSHLWTCPPISPCSVGLACPAVLYGEKIVPPTRLECLQETRPQQRSFPPGKGPNHQCSVHRCLQRSAPPCLVRPSFAPPCKQSTVGWLTLLNRLYICFTDNLLPTNANTNEEADDDGQQYVFDPSKSNNIFDEADNQSDKYDPLNDKEFQVIENNTNMNNEANNEADHEDEYNPDHGDWIPDNVDDAITASCSQHKKNNDNGTYHVHSQHLLHFLPPPTNNPILQGNLISAA